MVISLRLCIQIHEGCRAVDAKQVSNNVRRGRKALYNFRGCHPTSPTFVRAPSITLRLPSGPRHVHCVVSLGRMKLSTHLVRRRHVAAKGALPQSPTRHRRGRRTERERADELNCASMGFPEDLICTHLNAASHTHPTLFSMTKCALSVYPTFDSPSAMISSTFKGKSSGMDSCCLRVK